MSLLGTIDQKNADGSDYLNPAGYKVAEVLLAKCDNAINGCNNFTTNHDLAGSWCGPACFAEHECGERPTQKDIDEFERGQY